MKFTVFESPKAAESYAADLIAAQVRLSPKSVIGWATGGTMLGLYDALRQMDVSFKQTRAFNLDEYVGLGPDYSQSYHHYMRHHFFDYIDIDVDHIHLPSGLGSPKEAAAQYDQLLAQYGPIDLQLLGIGAILKARKVVLLACGSVKADAVKTMSEGPIDPSCPASALRGHPNVSVVLDQAAASHPSQ